MRRHLPLIVLGLLLADLASLIWLGGLVGLLPVLGLIVLGILAGSALIRRSGANIFSVLQTRGGDMKALSGGAAESLLGAIAGLLFMIPGFASDFIALALFLPWVRRRTAGFFETHVAGDFSYHNKSIVIEAEAVEIEEPPKLESKSKGGG